MLQALGYRLATGQHLDRVRRVGVPGRLPEGVHQPVHLGPGVPQFGLPVADQGADRHVRGDRQEALAVHRGPGGHALLGEPVQGPQALLGVSSQSPARSSAVDCGLATSAV